jgi:hypothetical protein
MTLWYREALFSQRLVTTRLTRDVCSTELLARAPRLLCGFRKSQDCAVCQSWDSFCVNTSDILNRVFPGESLPNAMPCAFSLPRLRPVCQGLYVLTLAGERLSFSFRSRSRFLYSSTRRRPLFFLQPYIPFMLPDFDHSYDSSRSVKDSQPPRIALLGRVNIIARPRRLG